MWQLSDTKLIASLHVLIESREKYMDLASQIRGLLHSFGIHSATIQPEFIDDKKVDQALSIMPKEENINQSETLNDTSSDITSDHNSGQVS